MDIILCGVKHELQISSTQIDKERSIMIDCFLFMARNLIEIGAEKLGFYFCTKAIRLCEIYGKIKQIGQLLFLMGCTARKLQRFQDCIKLLKKSLQYIWRYRTAQTNEKQIQIYSILSQCLLQINQPQQSKIFAYKYQIGYLEKDSSRIIQLSHQLIDSVQNRKSKWHVVSKQSMELLLGYDMEQFMKINHANLAKMDQRKIMQLMKINFQFLYTNFFQDDMFFYQIPMPLEVALDTKPKKSKIRSETKFLIKTKSLSVGSIKSQTSPKLLKVQVEKPKEFIIFNYRGSRVCKQKLCDFFKDLVKSIQKSKNSSSFRQNCAKEIAQQN